MVVPLYDGGIVVGRRVRTTSTSKEHWKLNARSTLWVETWNENQANFEGHQFSNHANDDHPSYHWKLTYGLSEKYKTACSKI